MPHTAEVTALKGQRTALKAKFTKFINFLNDDKNKTNFTQIKIRLNKIEPILDKFEEIQLSIDELQPTANTEFDEFEKLYYETISHAYDMLESRNASVVKAQNDSNRSDQTISYHNNVRLPKLELPLFDGAYDKWLSFYNSFKSMVHDNTTLSNIQRFHYLRSSLTGEAMQIISALEMSEKNYTEAWESVCSRYNNKRVICQKHVKAFFELPVMVRESASDLRTLIDTIKTHLNALKALAVPVDSWDLLVIYIITSKIDRKTHERWENTVTGTENPKLTDLYEFLEQRCQVLHMTALNVHSNTNSSNTIKSHNDSKPVHFKKKQVFTVTRKTNACAICKGSHKIRECETFLKMNVNDRVERLKESKICFNCFNSGHRNDECKWTCCKKCGKKHNTLIHYDSRENAVNSGTKDNSAQNERSNNDDADAGTASVRAYTTTISSQVLLSTALINVIGKDNISYQARLLLDNGSQAHFVTRKFANQLQLPYSKVDYPVGSLNNVETRIKQSVRVKLSSKDGNYKEETELLVVPQICDYLPSQFVDKNSLNIPKNIQLADPQFYEPREIDLLLGVDMYNDLLIDGQINMPGHKAKLFKTKLGWIISGRVGEVKSKNRNTCMVTYASLEKCMTRFWEIEEIPNETFLSEEEFQVEEHFKQTTQRDPRSGRYSVRLPFNNKITLLGESRKIAEKQFYALERKFVKNPLLKSEYVASMREAIQAKHMVPLANNEIRDKHCFLPHHPVIKESSSTTKLRIVYNASAKTSTGISLNDCLKVGAVVQSSSFDITLRFRMHNIVLLADIEKMYKQIRLDDRDTHYQLVLWRENEHEDLKTYMIPVVLFGCASAPHSATRVLNQLAEDEREHYPLASKVIKRDCYVDDVMTGAANIKDATKLRDELIGMTKAGGFILRKWVSNNLDVIDSLPNELHNIDILNENNSEMKALGIHWNRITDQITYSVKEAEFHSKVTKRGVLSSIARMYDPIGLLGPTIVSAKIIMQNIWQCKSGWDEPLPKHLHTAWTNVRNQLPKLNAVKFNRKVVVNNAKRTEIHGFCDASEQAYGACIYIRSIDNNGKISTNLLCSKNRVAPLNTQSLPRLELSAALILSRLVKTVLNALSVKIDDICLWSDSTITLQWIRTQPNLLKTFVANRVSEIRNITDTMRWRHVRSEENIADILSRGQLPVDLAENNRWKTGPGWLAQDPSLWPQDLMQLVPLIELKSTALPTIKGQNSLVMKYSSLSKLKRVMAYVLRYINNSLKSRAKLSGPINGTELKEAMIAILKIVQSENFNDEIKQLSRGKEVTKRSHLRALNPFVDDRGLIRVGGRLRNSVLSFSQKYPIVLPKDNHLTALIIKEEHILNLHCGAQSTLNAVRAKYWPINSKNITKTIIRKCVLCFRAKPLNKSYIMGDLPEHRVTQARPFLNVGLDYCGPFYIKEKKHRNRGKLKVYACVFVCFATKAIHIELVGDLTTEAFLAGLRRFFARRGRAANLYSDNATNFVGAKNELEALGQLIKSQAHNEEVVKFLTEREIKWHFSPPNSPHFGGLWEAAVKSFKSHFYKTVGDQLFTYEELQTYTTEIEAVLNSRPITPLSDDPNDLRALSPAHFLIGDTFASVPDVNLTKLPVNRLSSWEHIQFLKQNFWKRWYKEYLNQLLIRSKWQQQRTENIKIGSIVILREDNTPSLHWPLGRIVEAFPGDDGIVRVVTVKTRSGVYKRSVTRVVPLPLE